MYIYYILFGHSISCRIVQSLLEHIDLQGDPTITLNTWLLEES